MALNDHKEYGNEKNMSELFDNAFEMFNNILKPSDEPTNSLKIQVSVKKCMAMFEEVTKLVSMADIFSTNEDFEEIPTEHVKYFLLPAFLGTLTTKLCDRDNRLHNVNVSEVYFYDFLERVVSYKIINVEIPKRTKENSTEDAGKSECNLTPNMKSLEQMIYKRQNKLQRYKEQKELQDKLAILQKSMESLNIDEESKREFFVTLIKSYALQALDDIYYLVQEKDMLSQMAELSQLGGRENEEPKKHKERKPSKLKPIIITKNVAQKAVFGAGYPSLPVMTVDEFYEKKVADGEWAPGGSGQTKSGGKCLQDMSSSDDNLRQEDPEVLIKEEQVERDDKAYLAQARAFDEYRDTHKRGWGNRYNRS